MHTCANHRDMLPEEISPMLMPDTADEARVLLHCLGLGLYPTVEERSSAAKLQMKEVEDSEHEGAGER